MLQLLSGLLALVHNASHYEMDASHLPIRSLSLTASLTTLA